MWSVPSTVGRTGRFDPYHLQWAGQEGVIHNIYSKHGRRMWSIPCTASRTGGFDPYRLQWARQENVIQDLLDLTYNIYRAGSRRVAVICNTPSTGCAHVMPCTGHYPTLLDVIMWCHLLDTILYNLMWSCDAIYWTLSYTTWCDHVMPSTGHYPILLDVIMWCHLLDTILYYLLWSWTCSSRRNEGFLFSWRNISRCMGAAGLGLGRLGSGQLWIGIGHDPQQRVHKVGNAGQVLQDAKDSTSFRTGQTEYHLQSVLQGTALNVDGKHLSKYILHTSILKTSSNPLLNCGVVLVVSFLSHRLRVMPYVFKLHGDLTQVGMKMYKMWKYFHLQASFGCFISIYATEDLSRPKWDFVCADILLHLYEYMHIQSLPALFPLPPVIQLVKVQCRVCYGGPMASGAHHCKYHSIMVMVTYWLCRVNDLPTLKAHHFRYYHTIVKSTKGINSARQTRDTMTDLNRPWWLSACLACE